MLGSNQTDNGGLDVGELVPDFELPNQFGEPIQLTAQRGKNVLLVFYPFAFSHVCTTELNELAERSAELIRANTVLLAVSVDSKYSLRAYSQAQNISFDLLSDFWPHGAVAQKFGVFDSARGMAQRGTFAIDAFGRLRSSFFSESGQARPWQEYQKVLGLLAQDD